jgi:superfamily II DNA helicase RecQ
VKEGRVRILFASPESALGQHRSLIEDLASQKLIVAMAIDEAHCVLKYGYNRKTKSGKVVKAFRRDYRRLTELRAILGRIPLVALTATLTTESQAKLVKDLNMKPCFTLIMPPKKDNIKYIVHRLDKTAELDDNFQWLLKMLSEKKVDMSKTLVFFHKITKLGETYEFLDDELKGNGHIGDPPFNDKSHIFEMYHMRTDDGVKDTIIQEFSRDGHMRCVLASSSFSMGLDIPGIELVIHYGPAMDLDDFLQ